MSETPADDHREAAARQVASVRLRNARLSLMEYGLEPWGDIYDLHPGATLTLVSEGLNGEFVEIVLEEARVTTWSATGSTVTLLEAERELGAGLAPRLPVPRYPRGIGRPTLPLPQSAAHRVELMLLNAGERPVALWVPSQSEQYTLPPRAKCAVVAEGMTAGPIELAFTDDAVMLHGWPASQIAVLEEEPH